MKYIYPMEIASKVMTLIDLSSERLVIVSPYVSIDKWDKMKACLKRAIARGVKIEFYIRENADIDMGQFSELGIKPIRKRNLHAKLYYSEQYGIVTSQNMIRYSDDHSIDIGYQTETEEELHQLEDFRKRYLQEGTLSQDQKPNGEHRERPSTAESGPDVTSQNILPRQLEKAEVDRLCRLLKNSYPYSDFSPTSTYVFSSDLLGVPDAMFDKTFVVKFPHNDSFCNVLRSLDLSKHGVALKRKIETGHKTNTYVTFIPDASASEEERFMAFRSLIGRIKELSQRAEWKVRYFNQRRW